VEKVVLASLGAMVKGGSRMKRWSLVLVAMLVLFALDERATAQIAGSTTLGVTVEELKAVAIGWSAKRQILGKPVYNDQNARVGKIDDIIVTPDKSISFVIIGAGGFVGVGRHDVAIPVNQLQEKDGKYVLPGATKEAIKAMPRFEYAKKK
jgi:sporulation protein YlmC with PRC-barrel domain